MDKLKRTMKDYGGGTGRNIFESDYFSVTSWRLAKGLRTTIRPKHTYVDINFDGDIHFSSDDDCFSQMTAEEIIDMIKAIKTDAFDAGRMSKLRELKRVFEI